MAQSQSIRTDLPSQPFFVQLHPDTEQENQAPVPAIFQGGIEFAAGSLEELARGGEEAVVHLHLLVVDICTY
jgi:hypothetical protein